MHVLFVGLGGAGQRHLRVLRDILGSDDEWTAVRAVNTPRLSPTFVPLRGSVEAVANVRQVPSLDEGLAERPDLVVVSTPTSMHTTAVLASIEAGCAVLVEKPLDVDPAAVRAVRAIARDHGVAVFVGFQRHFHPAWERTQPLLGGALGPVLDVSMWANSDVTTWHPYQPLDELHALRADLGGGVLATESHELALCARTFGRPSAVACTTTECPGDGVERTATLLLHHDGLPTPCRIHLSFDRAVPARGWEISCRDGRVRWDEERGRLEVRRVEHPDATEFISGCDNEAVVARQDAWVLHHLDDLEASDRSLVEAEVVASTIAAAQRSRVSGRAEATT